MQTKTTNIQGPSYNYLEDYITEIRSKGRYVLTLEEVKSKYSLSDKAVNQALYRLKAKKRIAQIRKGIYAIITPEYLRQGMIPPALFIDDMMQALGKSYYVGLLSAAALYGAAHQQPMEFFVITEKPALRPIRNKKVKINFYVKKEWFQKDVRKVKTDAGDIRVSTPELTALDLIYYQESIGLSRTLTILEELAGQMKPSILNQTVRRYPQVTAVQRLGFLLCNELQLGQLAAPLSKYINEKKVLPIPLSTSKVREGELNEQWKVIKNIELESDL
jgi:predicted transcriptional regulator of viral defense system